MHQQFVRDLEASNRANLRLKHAQEFNRAEKVRKQNLKKREKRKRRAKRSTRHRKWH